MKFRSIDPSNPLYPYGWIPITRWYNGWFYFNRPSALGGNMPDFFHKSDNRIEIMTEANIVDEVLNKYLTGLVGPRREPTQ